MFGKKKATAESTYKMLCELLTKNQQPFEKHEAEKAITSVFEGDDLPITSVFTVEENVLNIQCLLMLKAEESKYMDVAWNLNLINSKLKFGSFRLDQENGIITFNYSYIFTNATLDDTLLSSVIAMTIKTVDDHDGDLKKISEVKSYEGPMYG